MQVFIAQLINGKVVVGPGGFAETFNTQQELQKTMAERAFVGAKAIPVRADLDDEFQKVLDSRPSLQRAWKEFEAQLEEFWLDEVKALKDVEDSAYEPKPGDILVMPDVHLLKADEEDGTHRP